MKKAQIRKVLNKRGHITFEVYESDERCHIMSGLDEPDCIIYVAVEFAGKNYKVVGRKTEGEAIRACLNECTRQKYEVDSSIPAFEHDAWDGSLKRLPDLDLQLSLSGVAKEKVYLERRQKLRDQLYQEHLRLYEKAVQDAITSNPDYYGKDFEP